MRTGRQTGMSLLEYCSYIGIDPFTMAQFGAGFPTGVTTGACDVPIFQHQYQRDMLSRDEFGIAIAQAERMIAEQLLYWPFPQYIEGEKVKYPRPNNTSQYGGGGNIHNQWKSARLEFGKVIGGGTFATAVIALNQSVTRLDEDGDGIFEVFQITVLNVATDLNTDEVAIYFVSTDRVGVNKDRTERWRIRPIYVTLSGTTLTIRGHTACIAKPTLYEGYDVETLDVTNATNFITAVDVYRAYLDDTATVDSMNQGTAIWENLNCDEPPCGVSYYPVCLGARDAELGFVSFNWTQSGSVPFRYDPDRVTVNYVSGVPLVNDFMQQPYGEMVAQLATALLPSRHCGCDRADKIIAHWMQPIYESGGEDEINFAPEDAATNPFGVMRGAVYAWRSVLERRQVRLVNMRG